MAIVKFKDKHHPFVTERDVLDGIMKYSPKHVKEAYMTKLKKSA